LLWLARVSGAVASRNSPCALISYTSSFGSCGSVCGGVAARAAGRSSRPKPVSGWNPLFQMSRALQRMRSNTSVLSSLGRAVQTQAVAAETIGGEKLVPLTGRELVGL